MADTDEVRARLAEIEAARLRTQHKQVVADLACTQAQAREWGQRLAEAENRIETDAKLLAAAQAQARRMREVLTDILRSPHCTIVPALVYAIGVALRDDAPTEG